MLLLSVIVFPSLAWGQTAVDPDPEGVLRKVIPDKLIVLTFDDAPASHATVVAPILKSLGFGGSIYVCNFDSFKTRKDWYLTWRQMVAMDADGLEIGNHTHGHSGGLENYLRMEDELIANRGPKMTTVCWPLYNVVWPVCPDLAARGYTFGRGGHERPYRPTVDNPFDVPAFSITDGVSVESFVEKAQKACQGRVVVFCFHGVPDMEHPPVSLEPATFKVMMDYLKENHYEVIAMRDMAKYIDPAKAAKLPRTTNDAAGAPPFLSIQNEKPYFSSIKSGLREFSFPGLPPVTRWKNNLVLTVPYGTDRTTLAPTIKLSDEATVSPASGSVRDFSQPQIYTVTVPDGAEQVYRVTVQSAAISSAKLMDNFTVPGALFTALSKSRIGVNLPTTTDLTALAPVFTLSPFATASPPSGTARDFTTPQSYTITAQDRSTQTITVVVVKSDQPNAFSWNAAEAGNWSNAANWTNNLSDKTPPKITGEPDYLLSFNQPVAQPIKNDLPAGFLLNQLLLGDRCGGLILSGNALIFTSQSAQHIPPAIVAGKCQRVDINLPITLGEDLTVRTSAERDPNCFLSFNEAITGAHALILESSGDPDVAKINFHDVHFGILQINHSNTYSGGTQINGGKINVRKADGLGTGPVSLNHFGTLSTENILPNPLMINQGTLFHCALSGPIVLNSIANLIGNCTISGGMSGTGGFTFLGTNGTYLSMKPGGTVTLEGTNTYTGATTIFPGTLIVKKLASLYNGDPAQWTPANLTVHKAATLRLYLGGPGEFTGEQIGTLLENLTRSINQNGLMGGAMVALNTTAVEEVVKVLATISDGTGPGGGPFVFKKCGAGSLELSGKNTFTGQTVLESGTLRVASLNSFTTGKGQPSSSLGAPIDIEAAEIVMGEEDQDGDCTLIYTGAGESTDRVFNLVGKTFTVTFDHSGTGPLTFTSPLLISGYGANKTIVLKGDTVGVGEITGPITDPHDRTGKATTAITKAGNGTWTLSGPNTATGPTKITAGTLCLATAKSLGTATAVDVGRGATLDLSFQGEMRIGKLSFEGVPQPSGTYNAKNAPQFIKGQGVLTL